MFSQFPEFLDCIAIGLRAAGESTESTESTVLVEYVVL